MVAAITGQYLPVIVWLLSMASQIRSRCRWNSSVQKLLSGFSVGSRRCRVKPSCQWRHHTAHRKPASQLRPTATLVQAKKVKTGLRFQQCTEMGLAPAWSALKKRVGTSNWKPLRVMKSGLMCRRKCAMQGNVLLQRTQPQRQHPKSLLMRQAAQKMMPASISAQRWQHGGSRHRKRPQSKSRMHLQSRWKFRLLKALTRMERG
mmetsp:Transcript_14095/g.27846  ORF Transcript_14095/g.27846 Transcript_14095/m.27846 type:complete len:204 (+) Transcript_14095:1692-2303(+)